MIRQGLIQKLLTRSGTTGILQQLWIFGGISVGKLKNKIGKALKRKKWQNFEKVSKTSKKLANNFEKIDKYF